jgi:hypothetical protein
MSSDYPGVSSDAIDEYCNKVMPDDDGGPAKYSKKAKQASLEIPAFVITSGWDTSHLYNTTPNNIKSGSVEEQRHIE